jgi:hypothetical protein
MLLSDALVIARTRGRAVRRRYWNRRRVVIAWDAAWIREHGTLDWGEPKKWSPTLEEMLVKDWQTCRP